MIPSLSKFIENNSDKAIKPYNDLIQDVAISMRAQAIPVVRPKGVVASVRNDSNLKPEELLLKLVQQIDQFSMLELEWDRLTRNRMLDELEISNLQSQLEDITLNELPSFDARIALYKEYIAWNGSVAAELAAETNRYTQQRSWESDDVNNGTQQINFTNSRQRAKDLHPGLDLNKVGQEAEAANIYQATKTLSAIYGLTVRKIEIDMAKATLDREAAELELRKASAESSRARIAATLELKKELANQIIATTTKQLALVATKAAEQTEIIAEKLNVFYGSVKNVYPELFPSIKLEDFDGESAITDTQTFAKYAHARSLLGEIADILDAVEQRSAYAAVPLVFRSDSFVKLAKESTPGRICYKATLPALAKDADAEMEGHFESILSQCPTESWIHRIRGFTMTTDALCQTLRAARVSIGKTGKRIAPNAKRADSIDFDALEIDQRSALEVSAGSLGCATDPRPHITYGSGEFWNCSPFSTLTVKLYFDSEMDPASASFPDLRLELIVAAVIDSSITYGNP